MCLHTLADPVAAAGPCAAAVLSKRLRPAVALRVQPTLCVCRPAIPRHVPVCSSSAPPEQKSRRCCREAGPAVLTRHAAHGLGAWCVSALAGLEPAAAAVHAEPANALSLPTWAIHVSSTVEWGAAMYLVWRYAEVTGGRPACCLVLNAQAGRLRDIVPVVRLSVCVLPGMALWRSSVCLCELLAFMRRICRYLSQALWQCFGGEPGRSLCLCGHITSCTASCLVSQRYLGPLICTRQ